MPKQRLDILLVERGLAETRTKAQALIMSGIVLVDGQRQDKPGTKFPDEANISFKEKPHPYVSRGGIKLEGALDTFGISPEGKKCLDIGASTGGFTHCLLLRGAAHVTALDVGKNLIDQRVRDDSRVRMIESQNARFLKDASLEPPYDLIVEDVSFISIRLILPQFKDYLSEDGDILSLVKPQFEVGKGEVGKGGIVRDPEKHRRVLTELREFIEGEGYIVYNECLSPIEGAKGNKEFFMHFGTKEAP